MKGRGITRRGVEKGGGQEENFSKTEGPANARSKSN